MCCVEGVLMGPSARIMSQDQLLKSVLSALWACLLAMPMYPWLESCRPCQNPI